MSEKKIDRVWQATPVKLEEGKLGFKVLKKLVTINEDTRLVNGTTFLPVYEDIQPNKLGQYKLSATAQYYDQQLDAMRKYAKKHNLKEIPPDKMGKLPEIMGVEEKVDKKKFNAALKENEKLRSELQEAKQMISDLNPKK